MARSPWARLTNRMTPKASDRPVANSAYNPPSRIPWMRALIQSMRYTPKYAVVMASRVRSAGGPESDTRPSSRQ